MSRLVATPTGQFNQDFHPVGHLGEAGTVMGQQRKKRRQNTGQWPPHSKSDGSTGYRREPNRIHLLATRRKYASCGIESYRRFRAPCLAQGRWCDKCGLQGHLARVCTKEMNLHMERGTNCEGTTYKLGRHRKTKAGVQSRDTPPTPAPGPFRSGEHV